MHGEYVIENQQIARLPGKQPFRRLAGGTHGCQIFDGNFGSIAVAGVGPKRFFNGNVRDYNNKVEMFPSSVIARATGFQRHDFFEIAELERAVPSVG